MKPLDAFHLVLESIKKNTYTIFSLGFDRLWNIPRFLLYPLFFTGTLAKYIIGYPLGVLIGGIAAGIIFFINLFKTKSHDVLNSFGSTSIAPTPTSQSAPTVAANSVFVPVSTATMSTSGDKATPLPAIPFVELTPSAEEIKATVRRKKIKEKQLSLREKNQALQTHIGQEIINLSVQCQVYDAHNNQILELKNRLAEAQHTQNHATKCAGYHTKTAIEFSPGLQFMYPNTPSLWYISKDIQVPSVVADHVARTTAAEQCTLLRQQLNDLGTMEPPTAYQARAALRDLKQRLERLCYTAITDADLSVQHATYMTVLNDVASAFSDDPKFRVNDFKPTSEYATCAYVSFWIKRLPKTFWLPEELKKYLIASTSDLSESDAQDIYQSCP